MKHPLHAPTALLLALAGCLAPTAAAQDSPSATSNDVRASVLGAPTLPELCAQYAADRGSLRRLYDYPFSDARQLRFEALGADWLAQLAAVDFDALDRGERVDWLLLRGEVQHDLDALAAGAEREREYGELVAFSAPLVALLEARSARALLTADEHRAVADTLAEASAALSDTRAAWKAAGEAEAEGADRVELSPSAARRASRDVGRLRSALQRWYAFSAEYDPLFTWWCEAPWDALSKELEGYARFLEETVGGFDPNDEDLLLGDPIGRTALLQDLAHERIAYSPEELIALAETELAWCNARRVEAATALGFGDDWRAAQEQVRAQHVAPGEQPALITSLSDASVEFLVARDLLRVPELAHETWRLGMMSPARQRFSPYFTGGEVISIAYPTAGMEHDAKLQAMRGNNRHFARATVHHELIPGHHLQGFMSDRWAPHRGMFRTPFLVEGWALYWELRLWDLGFAEGPEDELGMLFWRAHRAARILFSLNFHLGNWSPEECVEFLVANVGHAQRNAEAEVRRSIQGGYGPLYQAAYLLGGMQLYALHGELVERGTWSEADYHEAVLRQNSIPPDLIRALLTGAELTREQPLDWRFPGAAQTAR